MINLLDNYRKNIIQNQDGAENIRVGFAVNDKQALDIFVHKDTSDVVVQFMDIDQYVEEECLSYDGNPTELLPVGVEGELLFSDEYVAIFEIKESFGTYVFVAFNEVYIIGLNNGSNLCCKISK